MIEALRWRRTPRFGHAEVFAAIGSASTIAERNNRSPGCSMKYSASGRTTSAVTAAITANPRPARRNSVRSRNHSNANRTTNSGGSNRIVR